MPLAIPLQSGYTVSHKKSRALGVRRHFRSSKLNLDTVHPILHGIRMEYVYIYLLLYINMIYTIYNGSYFDAVLKNLMNFEGFGIEPRGPCRPSYAHGMR